MLGYQEVLSQILNFRLRDLFFRNMGMVSPTKQELQEPSDPIKRNFILIM